MRGMHGYGLGGWEYFENFMGDMGMGNISRNK